MTKKLLLFAFLAGLFVGGGSPLFALEKVKLGSSTKISPPFYLTVLAAEERGFWKDNGLEVEWVPFAGGGPQMRALAAGAINLGLGGPDLAMTGAERGLPVVIVADLVPIYPMLIYVRGDSPYRHIRDLKGVRIGIPTFLGIPHNYARIILAAHGMEKDVRFVAAGGVPEVIAGLRVGAFQAVSQPLATMAGLKVEGVVRDLVSAADYLPKPWTDLIIFGRKDFARTKPEVLRLTIKAIVQSIDFIRKNPRWALDKIKTFQGLSEEAAKNIYYDAVQFTTTGRLDRKAVENVRKVFIEYGILTEKAPAVDELFTNEYVPS